MYATCAPSAVCPTTPSRMTPRSASQKEAPQHIIPRPIKHPLFQNITQKVRPSLCARARTHTHTHTQIQTHTAHTYTCTSTHETHCAHTHTHMHMHKHTIHTAHTHMHTHTHTRAHAFTHTHMCTHTHANTVPAQQKVRPSLCACTMRTRALLRVPRPVKPFTSCPALLSE